MHLYYETGIQSSVISVNRCINHVETFEVFGPIKEKALSQINPRLHLFHLLAIYELTLVSCNEYL